MQFQQDDWILERPRFGSLDSILISPRKVAPTKLITLCHGFGAPGTDLVSLFEDILDNLPDDTALPAFLFPEGIIDLTDEGMPGGRAWWRLNMARLMQLAATHSFEAIRKEVPDGIDVARVTLANAIHECVVHKKWDGCKLIVGGFSQGAMLSVDTVLRGAIESIEALVICSGALICESYWREAAANLPKSIKIFQSHGTLDTVLPIETGRWLHSMLSESGFTIDYAEFDGLHSIPESAVRAIAALIAN